MKTTWTPAAIRLLREALGQDRAAFARHFRLSEHAVKRWELGQDRPSGPVTVLLDQIRARLPAEVA